MGVEKIVRKPAPAPQPEKKHVCPVPAKIPGDWHDGTIWSCDDCGEEWILNWVMMPGRVLLISPFIGLLNIGTVGILMAWGKSGPWRSKTSARVFTGLNAAVVLIVLVLSFLDGRGAL